MHDLLVDADGGLCLGGFILLSAGHGLEKSGLVFSFAEAVDE